MSVVKRRRPKKNRRKQESHSDRMADWERRSEPRRIQEALVAGSIYGSVTPSNGVRLDENVGDTEYNKGVIDEIRRLRTERSERARRRGRSYQEGGPVSNADRYHARKTRAGEAPDSPMTDRDLVMLLRREASRNPESPRPSVPRHQRRMAQEERSPIPIIPNSSGTGRSTSYPNPRQPTRTPVEPRPSPTPRGHFRPRVRDHADSVSQQMRRNLRSFDRDHLADSAQEWLSRPDLSDAERRYYEDLLRRTRPLPKTYPNGNTGGGGGYKNGGRVRKLMRERKGH